MQLYGSYTSPFVRHCRIALLETGLDCEFVETDAKASAQLSPTRRVPFLHDEQNSKVIQLTDSSAILKYLREKSGAAFLEHVDDYEMFCLGNTLLDTAINLFFLEKDGLGPEQSAYLSRQQARIDSGLAELNKRCGEKPLPDSGPWHDGWLRVACFLAWALFRERIVLAGKGYHHLEQLLEMMASYPPFTETAPPG